MTLVEEIEQALRKCKYAAPKVILASGDYSDQRIGDSPVFIGVEWEISGWLNPGEKFCIGWRWPNPHTKETAERLSHASDRLRRES